MSNIRQFALGAISATAVLATFQAIAQGHDPSLNPRVTVPRVNPGVQGPHTPDASGSGHSSMFVNGAFLFIYDEGMVYKLTTTDLRLVGHCNINRMMDTPMDKGIK